MLRSAIRFYLGAALCGLILFLSSFYSQGAFSQTAPSLPPPALPPGLENVGIDDRTGARIDLGLTFQDETGRSVALKTFFKDNKPVLMALVYYKCPNLCTLVLNGAFDSLSGLGLVPGKDYQFVAVSFDPRETPALAASKKAAALKQFQGTHSESELKLGWHLLVGRNPALGKLAEEVGFRFQWDPRQKQFAHASGVFVLTPQGRISRTFYGINYPSTDMKTALKEASGGVLTKFADRILLYCYHFEHASGKYALWASRIMTAGGAATVLAMSVFFLLMWKKEF